VLIYEQEAIFLMYRQRNRFLFTLLCTILLCSFVQATILQISVQDSIDNSTIPRATVFLNGENYARTNNNGQVFINHSGLNDQLIRVSMTGYDDWEKLVAKNETSVLVNLSRKNITLKVNLYDSDSLGPVPGARINISAEYMTQTNQTDVSGSVTFVVNATTLYSIDITAPDYLPRSGIIDMDTEDKDAQYWMLNAKRFSFIINDKNGMAPVPDAEVRINTALVGKTDSRGVLTTSVTRGKVYTIDIEKGGYQTFTESRTISNTDALYSVVLSKTLVGAFISVFDENRDPVNGTDIYINGTLSGTTNQFGRINFPNLVSGSYNVEVRKTGYITVNRTILIINKGEDYTFEIPFENADLTLFVQEKDQKMVPNTTIIINGNTMGVTDDHGLYRTKVKFNTLYNITAIKDTYQPVSVQKQFAAGNATASVTLIIEKSLDWGFIIMIVIGVLGVLIVFGVIRKWGGRKRRHGMRRNDI
jgi:hypothetical protein